MSDLKKSIAKLKVALDELMKNEHLAKNFEALYEAELAKGEVVDMKSRKKIADDSTVGSKENDKLVDEQSAKELAPALRQKMGTEPKKKKRSEFSKEMSRNKKLAAAMPKKPKTGTK